MGRGDQHGSNHALELRAQQVVLGRVVRIKCCAPHAGLPGDVADADVTVRSAMQQLDESGVNALARSQDAGVFALCPPPMRDTCRILFRNCPGFAVSGCHDVSGFIASPP